MQIISQFAPLPLAQPAKGTAVAMGYFDGIHIGHRAVIEGAVQWAKTHNAAPAVFTFRLPVENKMKGKRLLSTEDKHALIHSLGVGRAYPRWRAGACPSFYFPPAGGR